LGGAEAKIILGVPNDLFCLSVGSKIIASGGRQVKGEHVKDAAQDGSVKVLILPIAIFQWRRTGSRGQARSARLRAC